MNGRTINTSDWEDVEGKIGQEMQDVETHYQRQKKRGKVRQKASRWENTGSAHRDTDA
jgi:hypothetical protein